MSRVVFFEAITSGNQFLVSWYLARGYDVKVFDFTYQLKTMAWLRRLIHEGRVERIYVHHASRADGLAIDGAEWFYPRVSDHPLIRRLACLFGAEEAEPVFKYALVQSIFRYFYTRLYLERYIETKNLRFGVALIPELFCVWDELLREWCQERLQPFTGIRIPRWPRLLRAGLHSWSKVAYHIPRYLGYGTYLGAVGLARLLTIGKTGEEPLRAQYVMAITSEFQTQFSGGRRFDFLLDHERLTKENTVFLVSESCDGSWVEQARKVGYRLIKQSNYSGLKGVLRNPPRTIEGCRALNAVIEGLRRIRAPEWIHQAATAGLLVYIRETNFLERIRFSPYIYCNRYGLIPRWENALIRKLGGKSWWYAYSSGGAYTRDEGGAFAGDDDFGGRHRFWSYENADHFVAPCRQLIDYYRRHRQQIREYHDVGNIWSEQILEAEKTLTRDAVRREWFGSLAQDRKVIAWFDTSFAEAPNSSSTFTEAVLWYSDILRLADECPDLAMVIKPSKDDAYYIAGDPRAQWSFPTVGSRLMAVWAALRNHPRVRFLNRRTDPCLVIAASELTVTFPYSSVSAEALGARKRAIWYEPGERWRNTLYARAPLLVAHGYRELRLLVDRILRQVSDEQYEAYLDGTVRGLVDSYMDGKGVSRFRTLLMGGGIEAAAL